MGRYREDLMKRLGPRLQIIEGNHWLTGGLQLISYNGNLLRPRTALWVYNGGPIPEGNQVLRAGCYVRPCVNPEHVQLYESPPTRKTAAERAKHYKILHAICRYCGGHIKRFAHGDDHHVTTFFMTRTCPSCFMAREREAESGRIINWSAIPDWPDLECMHRLLDIQEGLATDEIAPIVRPATAAEAARAVHI